MGNAVESNNSEEAVKHSLGDDTYRFKFALVRGKANLLNRRIADLSFPFSAFLSELVF